MPVRSEAQRRYLNAHFGHEWVKAHHFDQKGKLPKHVRKGTAVKKNQGHEMATGKSLSRQNSTKGAEESSMAEQGEIHGETGSHGHHHKQAHHHLHKAIKHLHEALSHHAHAGKAHRKRGKKASHTKHRGHHKARGHEVPRGVGHY